MFQILTAILRPSALWRRTKHAPASPPPLQHPPPRRQNSRHLVTTSSYQLSYCLSVFSMPGKVQFITIQYSCNLTVPFLRESSSSSSSWVPDISHLLGSNVL